MKTLLLTTGLLLATSALADQPADTYNRVDFQVEVSQQAANDQLDATLGTELNNADPGVLAQNLATTTSEAEKIAAAYPSVKVSTGNQQTWPVYGASNTQLKGWRGRAELRLETTDFKAAGQLIAHLQSKLQLTDLHFSVADKTRHEVEVQLDQQAITAFRSRADLIRDAWGAKGYRMVTMNISSSGGQIIRQPSMLKAVMVSASPAPEDFSGGDTTLTVTASGTIELGN